MKIIYHGILLILALALIASSSGVVIFCGGVLLLHSILNLFLDLAQLTDEFLSLFGRRY